MKNVSVKVPNWFKENAVYQINPRTFSKEGTINSITKELPSLKELGFDVIYLCPIFVADESDDQNFWSKRQKASETNNPKNPYRMNDYFAIDEEYGSMDDLRNLVKKAHALKMKILLDLVYMHIGVNAPILKSHPEFAKQHPDGSFYLNEYNFVRLDFNCAGLREYLWSNMTYYIGAIDIDGFRCDVGDNVPLAFWAEGRRRMQEIKPDAVLIDEGIAYQSIASAFDACYNVFWHEDMYKFFKGEMLFEDFINREKERLKKVPLNGLLLNDMDNHDTVTDWPERTETMLGHDGMELIQVLNYSVIGVPMVYSGNELADSAKLSMFANRFYMGKYEVTDREALSKKEYSIRRQSIMKKLNAWRKESKVVTDGNIIWLDEICKDGVIAFKREYSGNAFVFIGNLTDTNKNLNIDLEIKNILFSNNMEISSVNLQLNKYGYIVAKV